MKRFTCTSLALGLLALWALSFPDVSRTESALGQRRVSRRPAAKPTARRPAIDYSRFSHATKKHQQTCKSCHTIPTGNWRKVREYPDIADYPGHDACVGCHRLQFFKGAKPVICSVCHSRVSPKDDARFAFRNPAGRRQFLIEFPHDKHQDVIASLLLRSPVDEPTFRGEAGPAVQSLRFISASFTRPAFVADDPAKHYNNCEICHGPRSTPAVAPAAGWVDGFVPDNQTLRSVPANHASCFGCHWKSEQPVNDNCAGCHKLPNPAAAIAPVVVPPRKSMKFRHGREQHVLECTTCHINITKATTLRGLKPDVPISPCAECHNKEGLRQDVAKELVAIDKNREFVCVYCHTSDVGRRDPPASHYLIAERPPVLRKDLK
ncbi:MAG TPA: cytochrome c3 family protein [Pyrinomonadaceae bacterium]|nr:cytochrome c3 family protein [Pyrinomonadaceae bacterium]